MASTGVGGFFLSGQCRAYRREACWTDGLEKCSGREESAANQGLSSFNECRGSDRSDGSRVLWNPQVAEGAMPSVGSLRVRSNRPPLTLHTIVQATLCKTQGEHRPVGGASSHAFRGAIARWTTDEAGSARPRTLVP